MTPHRADLEPSVGGAARPKGLRGRQLLDRDWASLIAERSHRVAPLFGRHATGFLERDAEQRARRLVVEDQGALLIDQKRRGGEARQEVAGQDELERLLIHSPRSLPYARPRMRHRACGARLFVMAAVLVATLAWVAPSAAQTAGQPAVPIPDPTHGMATPFEGSPASSNPVTGVPEPPRNPFMAPNPRNNLHDDPYMSDTYRIPGPLGDGNELSTLFSRECGSVTFDSAGRIVTVCVGLDRPVLALLDPHTLATLAAMPLPVRNPSSAGGAFTDFSGGGYFYLDDHDRAVVSTNDHHILVISVDSPPGFTVRHDYDLSQELAADEGIVSALPDWTGRIWFVSRHGEVGTIDPKGGAVRTMRLSGEGISNSFAVDETGGVYVVSDKALYRFDAKAKEAPRISWRVVYPNSGIHKPGQSDAGSGTTPTLMGPNWVAITDNADPMNVDVYRRAVRIHPKKRHRKRGRAATHRKKKKARLVC